tara:strand:- start:585804 stop:585989 length:186 start_codon:yes stop_codon:yes gene_type:complete
MDTNATLNSTVDLSSTDQQTTQSITNEIAISAADLIKMIEAGEGSDVNELVSRMLHERQAA